MAFLVRVLLRILFFPLTRIFIAVFAVVFSVALFSVARQLVGDAFGLKGQAWFDVLSGVIAVTVACLAYVGYVKLFERRATSELSPKRSLREFGIGAAIGFGLITATITCLWLGGFYRVEGIGRLPSAGTLIGLGLVAAFVEEIVIRGIIFRITEESLGTWIAVAISALLFGLTHIFNPESSWTAALCIAVEAGILLAAAYVTTRRLWFPIGMHFAWNFTQGGIFGVAVSGKPVRGMLRSTLSGPDLLSGGKFGAEASIFAVLVCSAMSVFLLVRAVRNGQIIRPFWSRNRKKPSTIDPDLGETRVIASAGAVLVAFVAALPARADEPERTAKPFTAGQLRFYEAEVKPLLAQHCLKCHGSGPKIRGGFRLDSREAVLRGGDLGPAATPGDPSSSLLVKAINYNELEMPPAGKLSAREIEVLSRWVKEGLPWVPGPTAPSGAPIEAADVRPPAASPATPKQRDDWSLRPVSRPAVPEVKHNAWCRTPIDAFILSRLEAEGLEPAPPADRTALIRRMTYDLTGLPPSPQEVDAFVADRSPDAFEHLTDRLLASPHYGEKWGRHWLDLVRYGETNGYERDSAKPFAWRYRDYVIGSLNHDKPYDQFVREQVAGDEIEPTAAEPLIATGFYRLGIWDDEPADRELARYDSLDGIVATTAQVFLGMSINCARCHDHKVDPIPQRDYYRLLAVFHNVTFSDGKNLKTVKSDGGSPVEVMSVAERGQADTHILLGGNPSLRGDKVSPGVPQILGGSSLSSTDRRSRRQALAHWLTDARNPRTARVMANRIWQYHFGRGIVPTPNEFGGLGEPATHPELLDWLASELIYGGWRLKQLHRTILLSSAYRMSSHGSQPALARDPSNRWFWRFPMRRLTAEEVRDSMLSVAGTLNLKAGGPPVHPPIPREVMAGQSVPGQGWAVSSAAESARRSVFVHVKRSLLVPILATHDAADTDLSCPVRYTTTVPTQALGLLNGSFANEQAARFAERLTREAPEGLPNQVRLALKLTTARKPDEHEVVRDVAFVKRITSDGGLDSTDSTDALTHYCLLILNTNAFLYLD